MRILLFAASTFAIALIPVSAQAEPYSEAERSTGSVTGHYSNGRWVPSGDQAPLRYQGGDSSTFGVQIDALSVTIRRAEVLGVVTHPEAVTAQNEVNSIREQSRSGTRDPSGVGPARNASDLQVRINRINDRLRLSPQ